MKIRQDFVTNSSSSSFLIAFSNQNAYQNLATALMNSSDEFDTSSGGEFINNLSELNQYCKEYGIDEDSSLHRSMADAIRKGYVILEKSIGYDASALTTLLYELAKIDSNIIILDGED